ncbi:MAG: type II toxin-antitoxin system VapC family toxin [Rhodocyclales bacterium]|nr:type II toxin-antitoxin system VapC family toxin [Rhodocyclales bacterium]
MIYLLDTNICIYAINGEPPRVRERLDDQPQENLAISTVTLAELEYGVLCYPPEVQGAARAALELLKEYVAVLPFDTAAAEAYAEIRKLAPERNRHAMDKLIAAHALSLGAVLVTNNEADFRRFPALAVENWAT